MRCLLVFLCSWVLGFLCRLLRRFARLCSRWLVCRSLVSLARSAHLLTVCVPSSPLRPRQVLAWRQTHLQRFRSVEQNKKFIQFSKGVEIDYDAITVKIEAEAENERSRPGAVPYS